MYLKILNREGAKDKYLKELYALFPREFNVYVEPFLGTGAAFLNLLEEPKYSLLNDLDRFIYWFFLVMQTERGADKLANEIENALIYFDLLKSWPNTGVVNWLAKRIIRMNESMYGHEGTIRLQADNIKRNIICAIRKYKDEYLRKLKYTKITCMDFKKFLRGICGRNKDYSDYFVYCDPPYVFDRGNLDANRGFKEKDLSELVDILRERNWKFAISCMDAGAEYFDKKGLSVKKIRKNVGLGATYSTGKSEWLAMNYEIDDHKPAELF